MRCSTPCLPRRLISPCSRVMNARRVGPSSGSDSASAASGWVARRNAASCTRSTQFAVVVVESAAVPPHPAVLVTQPRSEQRRARPAATSTTPWTAARPAENPHPPIHRRYHRTARRRSALPARLQGDSDRATPPTRARRLGGLPPDSRCSAPGPVNFETRRERGNRPSSHVPTGRRAFRSARILALGPRSCRHTTGNGSAAYRNPKPHCESSTVRVALTGPSGHVTLSPSIGAECRDERHARRSHSQSGEPSYSDWPLRHGGAARRCARRRGTAIREHKRDKDNERGYSDPG